MQRRNLIILFVAIAFGLIAVWLANSYFGALEQRNESLTASNQGMVRVLAAKQNLAIGDAISANNAALVEWPATSVPEGAILEGQAEAFIAQKNTVARPLLAGAPILPSDLPAGVGLAANIPVNGRAISIPVDAVSGLSGLAKPGDIVDVLLTRAIPGTDATAEQQMATVVLQNVPLLAIDARASDKPVDADDSEADKPLELKTATLMVDAVGAQKIALATQVGKLTLVLRNIKDRTLTVAATMLPRDLGGSGVRVAPTGAKSSAATATSRAAARPRPTQTYMAAPVPYRPTMTVVRGTQESVEGVISNGY